MPTPRFYCPVPLKPGNRVNLPANAAVHACRVLRLQPGDPVVLFNGDGHDYVGTLTEVGKNTASADVLSRSEVDRESPLKVMLAQAISAGERMDFTIQKAVELGVTSIQPIASQRSVVKLVGERADKRREHWQNVANAACEQSGRAFLPQVALPLALANWLGTLAPQALRLTLSPQATFALPQLSRPTGEICLLIGPEGGLTAQEIELASMHGFTPVRLGQRVLRTETAALAALASIQTLWGDFS